MHACGACPRNSNTASTDGAVGFDGQAPLGCLEIRRFHVLSSLGAMPKDFSI